MKSFSYKPPVRKDKENELSLSFSLRFLGAVGTAVPPYFLV